ncbi:MAG: hypothetical protein ACRD1C_03815 [Terriglobales bacterium]
MSDRIRDRLVREEHQRLVRQGWEVATVCSLLPFPLTVNLGELGTIQVPAATPEEPVQRLVINRYRLSMRDLGDGRFTPVSVLPRELAQEVNREFAATGGVFVFNGEDIPADATIAEARERMFAWFRRTYQQAVDSWGRYHQHSMLTDRMRDAAHALFRTGEIAALPEWISITRAQADRRDCTMCGESIKVNAKICHFCRTKVTPLAEGE